MREHMGLYRGKRVDNGEWVEGYLGQDTIIGSDKTWLGYVIKPVPKKLWDFEWYEVDPETVGECTGLRDKNGKLIFEGDVVKWDEKEWGCPFSEIAEWNYNLLSARKSDWKEWCEIIGNIHDNPELLKGERND